jgi:hypothetical protein
MHNASRDGHPFFHILGTLGPALRGPRGQTWRNETLRLVLEELLHEGTNWKGDGAERASRYYPKYLSK